MPDQESPVQQGREAILDLTLAAFKDCPNPVVEAHANKLVDAFESAVRDDEADAFNRQPILRHCLHPGCLREFDMGASLGGGPVRESWSSKGWKQIRPTVATGYICPDHASLMDHHRPSWDRQADDRVVLRCACGWGSPVACWQGYAVAAWQDHLLAGEGDRKGLA
ncbi:hypothetical protein OG229_02550 [Streptomyces platensis]|uniref:hypothetical protein n=1 Tax=Streptomyces platensis TaxID=58346 RepID=UPI002E0D4E5B|nr:hypothetical protein OG229_02550 [Streptomyces platensis]